MTTAVAIVVLGLLAGVSLLLAPELAADVTRVRRVLRGLLRRRVAGGIPPGEVAASARRRPGQAWNPSPAAGGAPGVAGPGAVPASQVPAGWTVSPRGTLIPPVAAGSPAGAAAIRCGGRVTGQTVPRKRTSDRPPWDTQTRPVPALTGAAGGCTGTTGGQPALTRPLGLADLGPADSENRTFADRVRGS